MTDLALRSQGGGLRAAVLTWFRREVEQGVPLDSRPGSMEVLEYKRTKALGYLGTRWLLHKANEVKRKT